MLVTAFSVDGTSCSALPSRRVHLLYLLIEEKLCDPVPIDQISTFICIPTCIILQEMMQGVHLTHFL